MSKWRVSDKSKNMENFNYQNYSTAECNHNQDMQNNDENAFNQQHSSQKLAEHHDTLQTSNSTLKKGSSSKNNVYNANQRVWRNVPAIEKNIDNLHFKSSSVLTSGLDRKVDYIIKKKEK